MVDHLDSKNFVPFSKRRNGFRLPGVRKDPEEEMLEQLDPELRPEDQGMVRRYLQYADILLGSPDHNGLTLVQGGGPAKRLAGITETHEFADRDQSAAPEQTAITGQTPLRQESATSSQASPTQSESTAESTAESTDEISKSSTEQDDDKAA
jgi:hypothetical protein